MVSMVSSNIGKNILYTCLIVSSVYSYSDFLVNEISSDGTIVRLTDLSCPDYNQNKTVPLTVSIAIVFLVDPVALSRLALTRMFH